MRQDDVLYLFTTTYAKNSYGVPVPTNTKQEVFCELLSITRQEFFNAGLNGFKPSYAFRMFAGDYEGQSIVEYRGQTYSVYRTYLDGDYIELYVELKGGTNGQEGDSGQSGGSDPGDP